MHDRVNTEAAISHLPNIIQHEHDGEKVTVCASVVQYESGFANT